MNTLRTRPKYSLLNVRTLVLIYLFLTALTVLFSRSFLSDILRDGAIPGSRSLAVFFTIPAALLLFVVISIVRIIRDLLARRTGSRFQALLMTYFVIIVVLAAVPVVLVTNLSIGELLRFWRTISVNAAMDQAQRFAMETYSLNIEKLEAHISNGIFDAPEPGFLPREVLGVQDFREERNIWMESRFSGGESLRLSVPPGRRQGPVPRELPRDADVIRYVLNPAEGQMRVITWNLGEGFDSALEIIENERTRFDIIDSIRFNIGRLLVFYYGVFFLPALLMTFIIALSFTRRVTSPITELAEATRRVAEGDFSIQILPRRGDELTLLIKSFNAMVRDLEKSREALVKAEKISIWQNMAEQLAHEIKNPLTPIKLSAERVLRRWQNEPERIGEILESSMMAIIQETDGLSAMLTEFRTLSRPAETSRSRISLKEVVEETISPYGVSHPGVCFDIDHVEAGIILNMDRRRFSQALTNLIVNSIDAMDGSGLIEIRTDLVKKRESRYCRICIHDSGRGIPEQDAQHVFTPYFTTKKSGTGLGLPIVERIVNDLGGTIWFNSAEGAGAAFFIDLPLDGKEP
jgi:nitrogen fixation/metabolism regulation signal transduction histidine kinase